MTKTNQIFDSWLVLECQLGNTKAMSLLVKRWHRKLCRHASWYIKDPDTAKDVVQDCWGIILRKIYGLKDPNSFGSWAMSIVTRKSIDLIRKKNRELINKTDYYEQRSNDFGNDHNDHSADPLDLMKGLIEELPEGQKMVLHLFYMEEFSIKQISEALNLAQGTVKSRLYHAREKLRITYKERNHEK
jgi:RNA polymerase sigma-70 factor (ECF subfamily)